jgi:large subunit ribosomal protein L2
VRAPFIYVLLVVNRLSKDLEAYFSVKVKGKTSNASKNISMLRFKFPLQLQYSKLLFRKGWKCGRGSTGRITVFSKGPKQKKRVPVINYRHKSNCLFFVAGVNYTGTNLKLASLTFCSTGEVSYLPSLRDDKLFLLFKKKPLLPIISPSVAKDVLVFNPYICLLEIPYLLIQQKKNTSISLLESWPLKGIQYTRSFGSKAKILKLDTRTGLSLVSLPSGIKKVFSAFSLSSAGHANLHILKNRFKDTKSGNWRKKGRKSIVRGVAMNPVDHPHGGRTNSIKYPRTPWGKTTKFK